MKIKSVLSLSRKENQPNKWLAPVPLNQPIAQDLAFGEVLEIERKLRNTAQESGVALASLKQLVNFLQNGSNEISQNVLKLVNELVSVKTPALEEPVLIKATNIERFLVPLNFKYVPRSQKISSEDYLQHQEWKLWNVQIARQNSQDLLDILKPCLNERLQLEAQTQENLKVFKQFAKPHSVKIGTKKQQAVTNQKKTVNQLKDFSAKCAQLLNKIEEVHLRGELLEAGTLLEYIIECINASTGIITGDQDIVTRSRDYMDNERIKERIYENIEPWNGQICILEEIYAKFSDYHKKMSAHGDCIGFLRVVHEQYREKQTISEDNFQILKNNSKTIQHVFKEILRCYSKGKLAQKGFGAKSKYIDY